jgi:(p)ppGpp synthase/HD superfamily hydrolase
MYRNYTEEDVSLALSFASKAHAGQLYGSKDYFTEHIMGVVNRLMEKISSARTLIVGALHDIYEDTDITREEIISIFGEDIDECVWILTRQENEEYFDYIRRVKNNAVAKNVKLEDVTFNYRASELMQNVSMQMRYGKALLILLGYD